MSVIGKRKIFVGPADGVTGCKPLSVEALAKEADIKPGMIVEFSTTGLIKSDTNGGNAGEPTIVALEYGDHYNGDVDTVYTSDETMLAAYPRSGEFFNVLVVAGNNITKKGTPLTSNGAGKWKISTPATEEVLAYADEVINVSGTDALVRAVFL